MLALRVSKMPPKQTRKAPAPPSKSRELVRTGPKELVVKKNWHVRRDENGQRPTTTRALVLRNGKHGAMGTGEVVLSTRISGREKLELLAGNVYMPILE